MEIFWGFFLYSLCKSGNPRKTDYICNVNVKM
nr:MAG TPA: hypothetical protein [Caudoviricetes sp.]